MSFSNRIPPPPPLLPSTAKLQRLSPTLPPPPPPPVLPAAAAAAKPVMRTAKAAVRNAKPPVTNTVTQINVTTTNIPVNVSKRRLAPGEPGVPIPLSDDQYKGRVNSSVDPAYDINLQLYYADFNVKDKNGFLKLYRMFGNSPGEVIQYIFKFKQSSKAMGIQRSEEPVTINSIIKQLEILRKQKQ